VLNESKLISFIDEKKEFTLHIAEGQKIIHDLAIIHDLKGKGFAFFRDCVLSAIPLITLLKPRESMGFYIDSDQPYFMFKVEMSESGHFRTLLLPDEFSDFPEILNGKARLTKIYPGQKTPYSSVVALENVPFHEAVNNILRESYQIKGQIILSEDSDQVAFLMQLPRKNWDKDEEFEPSQTLEDALAKIEAPLSQIFAKGHNDSELIIPEIEALGFQHLLSKDLNFKCACSYERMVSGVLSLVQSTSLDEVFENKDSIETKCDYCKTFYQIPKDHIGALLN
jgi:molecular chaperone Hsp33